MDWFVLIRLQCYTKLLDTNNGSILLVLYLQADNSSKDNKNKFVIIFLAMLVKANILKKIKLTVLMMKHAHEDIYQMFSCISKKAQTHKRITFQTFMTWFGQASHQSRMQDIWKVCGIFWGKGVIGECLRGIKNPHVFKLTKMSGRVILSYNDWLLVGENYREVDLTIYFQIFRHLSHWSRIWKKYRSSVEKMKKDLQRWEERVNEERLAKMGKKVDDLKTGTQWWEMNLTNMMREKDDCSVPLASSALPKYRSPPIQGPSWTETLTTPLRDKCCVCRKQAR